MCQKNTPLPHSFPNSQRTMCGLKSQKPHTITVERAGSLERACGVLPKRLTARTITEDARRSARRFGDPQQRFDSGRLLVCENWLLGNTDGASTSRPVEGPTKLLPNRATRLYSV